MFSQKHILEPDHVQFPQYKKFVFRVKVRKTKKELILKKMCTYKHMTKNICTYIFQ